MKLRYLIVGIYIILSASACYEKEEGCLDSTAVNFDVTADEDCCCDYPKLVLQLNHTFGESGLSYGVNYLNNIGSPFKIIGIQYYLSAFTFVDDNGEEFTITDQKDFKTFNGDNITRTNDFIFVNERLFSDSIGLFPSFGEYQQFYFVIGANDVPDVDPTLIETDHSLATKTDTMWVENDGFAVAKIELIPDTTAMTDTLTFRVFEEVPVVFNGVFQIGRGAHIGLNLKADYQRWFDDIDFQNDSNQEISDKINSNLASSLSFN